MPLPKRIEAYLTCVSTDQKRETTQASLRCPCGSVAFHLHFDAERARDTIVADKRGNLALSAECTGCAACALLFDQKIDGYDARTEHDQPDDRHRRCSSALLCDRCGGDAFHITMQMEYTGLDELDEDQNPGDFYSWIRIDALCDGCKRKMKGLIDAETA